jgi:hypothetical protein
LDLGPVLGRWCGRSPVDAGASPIGEVAAEEATGRSRGRAGQAEHHATKPLAAAAGEEGQAVEGGGDHVGGGMDEAGATFGLVQVGPVGHPRRRRRQGGGDADADQGVGRGLGTAPADQVEHKGARPEPDGQIGEQGMQWMAEPHAMQRVLDGTAGECAGDGPMRGLGDSIERAGGLETLTEVARIHGCPPHPAHRRRTANRGMLLLYPAPLPIDEAHGQG